MASKKRKMGAEQPQGGDLVQVMTISLFIILLAFFILLNSIAVIDEKKMMQAVGSIIESFGGESAVETPSQTTAEEVFTDGISPVELHDLVSGEDERVKDMKVKVSKTRTTLTIPEDMLFTPVGTRVKRSGIRLLKKLSGVINSNAFPVDISAHTDDVPIHDRAGIGNTELTALRSNAILSYLVEKGAVSPTRIVAYGWGMERPSVPNTTAETRKINRRVDITFVHDASKEKSKGFFLFKDFFFNVKDTD